MNQPQSVIHSMVDEYCVAHNQFLNGIWQANSKILMGGKSITMAKQKFLRNGTWYENTTRYESTSYSYNS